MARPKSTNKTVHTAIRLPAGLHQQLSAAATGSLAEEIKSRLEASMIFDSMDSKTRDLVATVAQMASLIREDFGPDWFAETFVRDAFAEAIAVWLDIPNRDRDIPFGASEETAKRSRLWIRKNDDAVTAGANLVRLHNLISSRSNGRVKEDGAVDPSRKNAITRTQHVVKPKDSKQ